MMLIKWKNYSVGKRLLILSLSVIVVGLAVVSWRYRDLIADIWKNLFLYYQD